MKRKLGINCDCVHGQSPLETMEIIKDCGFEATFTSDIRLETVKEQKKKADNLGLQIEFIHAPFRGINNLWLPGVACWDLMERIEETIDTAAACGIPAVILHVSSGYHAPDLCDIGMERFDRLVKHAREKGVIACFENLRKVGNLSYLADRYHSLDCVRFCYDCGHRNCYTPEMEWIDFMGKRIIATHIHDNPGQTDGWNNDDDLHLLPFDGTCDYKDMIRRMDRVGYEGTLMLEVFNGSREDYRAMTPEAFVKECYRRIKRIRDL